MPGKVDISLERIRFIPYLIAVNLPKEPWDGIEMEPGSGFDHVRCTTTDRSISMNNSSSDSGREAGAPPCDQCLGVGVVVDSCEVCDGWGLGEGSSFEIGWPCATCRGTGGRHVTTCPTCQGEAGVLGTPRFFVR